MIDDTLTAARLDLARGTDLPVRRDPVPWHTVTEQAAARFRELHPEHALEVRLARQLPEVLADVALIRRAADNYLDNAARYSEPSAGPVELAVTADPAGVRIEVRDRGVGVTDEDRPRLFEPFFRGDRSRDRATGGVGMGLALCRRIAEAHGGRVGVEARDGGGTVVWLVLPGSD